MIKTGRYGTVSWDPTGTPPVPPATAPLIISLNKWKASFKTDKLDVTCFGDVNRVYIPGMKDVSGTVAGFWNSAEIALFEAADAEAPGFLALAPNSTEPDFNWSGSAYMDADIDCSVDGAPTVSGTFMAAGPWTFAHTP